MAEIAWSIAAYARQEPARLRPKKQPPAVLPPADQPRHFRDHRTIFISDTHLGTRGCKADLLADFLARNSCDTLYLVGDIIDGWQFRRWYWSEAQERCIAEVLKKIDEGTRVIYVPGNHDEFLRSYVGRSVAGIEVMREAIHTTAQGLRLLVLHGDQFDGVIGCAKWLAHVGDHAYTLALRLNDGLHPTVFPDIGWVTFAGFDICRVVISGSEGTLHSVYPTGLTHIRKGANNVPARGEELRARSSTPPHPWGLPVDR